MKNSIYIFFLAIFLFQACDKKDDPIATCENCNFTCLDANEPDVITNDCINNWECSFKLTPQSKVELSNYDGLASGDKNVFQMINSTEGDLMIADDEYTNFLVFELEESQDSFSVTDTEMEAMQVHYKVLCFCSEVEFKSVTSGCMQGEKQSDGTWFIQGNLIVSYDFGDVEVKVDAKFVN